MKVFILAAGAGTRISRVIQGQPKCLLRINGQSLISRMIERLKRFGLSDITLVTGYKAHLIREELGDGVRYVHNPFSHVTNSIASLWFARDQLEGDALLINGDLFFEDRLLEVVLSERRNPVMVSDSSRIEEADYRFKLEGERIVGYGKDISNKETDAEYVGMALIRGEILQHYKKRLLQLVNDQRTHCWWEDVLFSLIPDGMPVFHLDIKGIFWAEVDYVEDYDRIVQWTRSLETGRGADAGLVRTPNPAA